MRKNPLSAIKDGFEFLEGRLVFPKDLLRRCSLSDSRICTYLGGSLIEGLGNSSSDLDIYAIGDELPQLREFNREVAHRLLTSDRRILRPSDDPAARVFLAHYAVGDTRMKVDVEFHTHADVLDLAERVRELHAYAAQNLVLLTRRLTSRENDFVTRLLNAQPLTDAAIVADIQAGFDRQNVLYLAYRWLASDFSNILDIVGAWGAGDLVRGRDLARENLTKQMQAYLHLKGMMNLKRKWLLVFVDRLLGDEPALADRFQHLFFFVGDPDPKTYIVQTLDFIDEIFVRSEQLLIANASGPTGRAAIKLLARDRDLSDSRYAHLEFEYRAKVYGQTGRPTRTFLEEEL